MTHPYATAQKILHNKLAKLLMRGPLGAPTRSCILMFHDIVPNGAPLPDEYACSLGTLKQIVAAYRARGFTFVPLETLLHTPYREAKQRLAVLTFDDGFSSLYTLAAPFLSEAGIPFTAYITPGYLGTPGYLDAKQLQALATNPLCTVGSHLLTHPMTRFLFADEVRAELESSRAELERLTGRPVLHLAFPYGSAYACSLRDVRLAKKCGYRSAALTTPTTYHRMRLFPNYTLPRLNMPQDFPS